ncbi:MAG: hypothetical protein HY810_03320 [Candidatus Omnitrophica bacterium]|nr:hypothetical protein [Candidatus Omnitrophota bacterium]
MDKYKFTHYFESEVLRKRPYLTRKICVEIIKNHLKSELQENNRFRFWGKCKDLDGKILRVVTLEDKTTIHNPKNCNGEQKLW